MSCAQLLSCVQLFATPWTVACQAPLSMGFSRQKILEWVSVSSPGDLSHPGIEAASPALAGGFFTIVPLGKYKATSSTPQSSLCLLISSHCSRFYHYALALPALKLPMNLAYSFMYGFFEHNASVIHSCCCICHSSFSFLAV